MSIGNVSSNQSLSNSYENPIKDNPENIEKSTSAESPSAGAEKAKVKTGIVFQGLLRYALLPAVAIPRAYVDKWKNNFMQTQEKSEKSMMSSLKLTTKDDVKLDGFQILNEQQMHLAPKDQKWMICFNPNSSFYEHKLKEYKAISDATGVNVLTINYRGVGHSKDQDKGKGTARPKGEEDLITDAEALVAYLKEKGVPSRNILAYGLSQGGAVAAQIAARNQTPGDQMHVCIDRSFTNYKSAVDETIRHSPVLRALTVGVKGIMNKFIENKWKFDSEAALKGINGHRIIINHEKDGIIYFKARFGLLETNSHQIPYKLMNVNFEDVDTSKESLGKAVHSARWIRPKDSNHRQFELREEAAFLINSIKEAFLPRLQSTQSNSQQHEWHNIS